VKLRPELLDLQTVADALPEHSCGSSYSWISSGSSHIGIRDKYMQGWPHAR